jgi:hypothetical protein
MATYTITVTDADYWMPLGSFNALKSEGWHYRVIFKFVLPVELMGVTPTSAVFTLRQIGNGSGGGNVTVLAKTSTTTWAKPYADLTAQFNAANGLVWSSTLSSLECGTGSGIDREFDVLGDSTKGVREACEQSRPYITVCGEYSGMGSPTNSSAITPALGQEGTGLMNVRDFAGYNDATYPPKLVITADGGGGVRIPRPGVFVDGIGV